MCTAGSKIIRSGHPQRAGARWPGAGVLADPVAALDRRALRVEAVVVPALALLALLGRLALLGCGADLGNRAVARGGDGRRAGIAADFLLALLALLVALAAALLPAQPRNPARGQEDRRGQAEKDHAGPG